MFSLEKFADIGGLRREYLLKRKNILGKARFMQTLVSRSRCRNSSLMEYFGEITLTCGKCDHCRAAESGFHSGQWTDGEIRMIAALGGFNGKIPIENLRSIVTGLKEKERLKSGFGSLRGTDRKVFGGIVLRLKNFHVLEFDPGNTSAGLNPLFKKWLDGR
jgi:superfamily II DNA helicase RecQ